MTPFDWILIGVIAISAVIGIWRGFVKEVLSVLTWVIALIVAYLFSDKMAVLLQDQIANSYLRTAVAGGILFALTLIVGAMVNYLIAELVKMTGLSGTDRFFGVLFGAARGFLIVLVFVIFMAPTFSDHGWWKRSELVPHVLKMEGWTRSAIEDTKSFVAGVYEKLGSQKSK